MLRFISLLVFTIISTALPQSVKACDCNLPKPSEIFSAASLVFIGRARKMNFSTHQQSYKLLSLLKGKANSATKHTIHFGKNISNCMAITATNQIALVAIVNNRVSICQGSGSLHGSAKKLAAYLKLAGASYPAKLSADAFVEALKLILTPQTQDVFVLSPVRGGPKRTVAKRSVYFIDAIDGMPANIEIIKTTQALMLGDLVYLELRSDADQKHTMYVLLRIDPKDGASTVLWAFGEGGSLRIPSPK